MSAARLPSLRRLLLRRVLLPLALTWLIGGAVGVGVAGLYARQVYDRSLVDDVFALAASVGERDGQLVFNLSPREVAIALFDRAEVSYFAVQGVDGSLLAGQGGLVDAVPTPDEPLRLAEHHYRGHDLRMVTLRRELPQPHVVAVAQTTRSRSRLYGQLFAASLLPQALLLVLLGAWLRHSMSAELRPLVALEQALARRDSEDLAPLEVTRRNSDIAVLAEACNALMARIDAGVRAQREFAGNVAHELRTPLAGIRSLAAYGLGQQEPQAWRRQLQEIAASERRASRLVEQLLALALADEARAMPHREAVALRPIVSELILSRLRQADAEVIDLGVEGLDDDAVWVRATPALLEGLLGNLVDNALRHGRPTGAGAAPRVTLKVEVNGDEVHVGVVDNGPGLDSADLSRLRSRWQQGGAAQRGAGGVGLGLAIVERYAALLGGRLEFGPASDGRGLRVTVTLPRAAAPQAG